MDEAGEDVLPRSRRTGVGVLHRIRRESQVLGAPADQGAVRAMTENFFLKDLLEMAANEDEEPIHRTLSANRAHEALPRRAAFGVANLAGPCAW